VPSNMSPIQFSRKYINLRSSSLVALTLTAQSFGLPVTAQNFTPARSQNLLLDSCSKFVGDAKLSGPQIKPYTRLAADGVTPSEEEVSRVIKVTQCNWEIIKGSAQDKAKKLTMRINLIKGLSTSVTVLGAGGTAAAASGSNSGLAIGSGAVAMIGIFAGVFGSESTIKRRDMCNQLVTLDPTIQTTFSIWSLQLPNESFRKGFVSELQSYNSTIDSGVKGCIADSYSS
jgi:hypothetical protein